MTVWLREQGHAVNRKRVKRLMQLMGLEAIYQRQRTSRPAPSHCIYPYPLRGLNVERINQVWAAHICYIPTGRGVLYLLVAVLDWVSRYVLAWRLSNLLDADFCVEVLQEALSFGRPGIFNPDQGSQFTDQNFTGALDAHGSAISMDGCGRFSDNIFVSQLWRSARYAGVYLKAAWPRPKRASPPTSGSTTTSARIRRWVTAPPPGMELGHRAHRLANSRKTGRRGATLSGLGR
jgi:putative transposase